MKLTDAKLAAKVAALKEERIAIDLRDEEHNKIIHKERKQNVDKLASLMAEILLTSIPGVLKDENFTYSDYEQLADPNNNEQYYFSVSLERISDDIIYDDDEDDYATSKVASKTKQTKQSIIPKITNYAEILSFCGEFSLRSISYKDCSIRFGLGSIEIESYKSQAAVFDLLNEWRVPVNLESFLNDVEKLESSLRLRRELLDKLQNVMLFTVGKQCH